jgi:hypothetical protein
VFLKRNFDLEIFIHDEGEEFWLIWNDFPQEVLNARLPIKTDPGKKKNEFNILKITNLN